MAQLLSQQVHRPDGASRHRQQGVDGLCSRSISDSVDRSMLGRRAARAAVERAARQGGGQAEPELYAHCLVNQSAVLFVVLI